MKKVLFIIAKEGFRDEEYFIPKSILATDFEIVTASNGEPGSIALGSLGGEAKIDLKLNDVQVDDYEAVIFVGGPGALKNLDSEISYRLAQEALTKNKILAGICIAPVILAKAKVLENKQATVWSSPLDKKPIKILEANGARYLNQDVVEDGNTITANGPQSAEKFGQKIKAKLSQLS